MDRREIWKYGPRGWRYTHLDVGHAIGAFLLSAKLADLSVAVVDAASIKQADTILGLDDINHRSETSADHREREHAVVFLLLSPNSTTCTPERLSSFLSSLSVSSTAAKLQGQQNHICGISKHPFQWSMVPLVDAVTAGPPKLQFPACSSGVSVSEGASFHDKQLLASAIRTRRSAVRFEFEEITAVQLGALLSAISTDRNDLVTPMDF